jgi:hypothetical protein
MSEYIVLDQYMKIQKTGNDFIYMEWSSLSKLMISLGWINKDIAAFSAYNYKWEFIGLKYIKRTFKKSTLLHFEVVDKNKFLFILLKHCTDFDGIHYHR